MKKFRIRYTKQPTNYHDSATATVEAADSKAALDALVYRLGDYSVNWLEVPGRCAHWMGAQYTYEPPVEDKPPAGRVLSLA